MVLGTGGEVNCGHSPNEGIHSGCGIHTAEGSDRQRLECGGICVRLEVHEGIVRGNLGARVGICAVRVFFRPFFMYTNDKETPLFLCVHCSRITNTNT